MNSSVQFSCGYAVNTFLHEWILDYLLRQYDLGWLNIWELCCEIFQFNMKNREWTKNEMYQMFHLLCSKSCGNKILGRTLSIHRWIICGRLELNIKINLFDTRKFLCEAMQTCEADIKTEKPMSIYIIWNQKRCIYLTERRMHVMKNEAIKYAFKLLPS